ncbi:MAG TPA: DeoR family transcriptional regulator, partial [Nocardioidaceae bacterium]|nr:DeoR family transcriptional regulator [Nocardioidaceae bacterium]
MAELVSQQGRLSVNELADAYGITTETVRRDLS